MLKILFLSVFIMILLVPERNQTVWNLFVISIACLAFFVNGQRFLNLHKCAFMGIIMESDALQSIFTIHMMGVDNEKVTIFLQAA